MSQLRERAEHQMIEYARRMRGRAERAEGRVAELQLALEYYADVKNWMDPDDPIYEVDADREGYPGALARQALHREGMKGRLP